jgi:hypothetical protein
MNAKEAEYYAFEFTDAQIDTMADAGDVYLEESDFYLIPKKAEIEKMMVEGEAYLWLEEGRPRVQLLGYSALTTSRNARMVEARLSRFQPWPSQLFEIVL